MRNRLRHIQEKPTAPLVVALVFSALVIALVLFIAQYAPGRVPLRGSMEAPRFLPSVDLLVLGSILVTGWGISVNHRCTDAVIEHNLFRIVLLIVLWLVLAMGKLVVATSLAKTLLWYGQCLPLLFIPLLFFFCVLRASSLDSRPGIAKLKRALACIALVLFILVVTNNFHHLVFAFDMDDPNWESDFSYGPVYYPCLALMMATMVASVILLAVNSHHKMRWRIIWIAGLFALGIAYWFIVMSQSGVPQPGNNALAGSMLFVAAIEFCLDLGFLPTAHHYSALFRNLPFDLKIITPSGTVAYRTAVSRSLDNTSLARLTAKLPANGPERELTTRSDATPGLIFKLYKLSAGMALLTEDANEIDQLQARLKEQQNVLANQNELLGKSQAMQALLFQQQREQELEERVEHDLVATTQQISDILDNLIPETADDSHEERIAQLNLVKVLVAYCKRKGMLALAAAESDMLTADQLNLIAREAMADLQSVGIECAVLVAVSEPVPIAAVNTVYDSFYDCIISVLPQANPVVMTFISVNEEGQLELRATIECAIGIDSETAVEQIPAIATSTESWTAMQTEIARDLEKRLSVRDGLSSVSLEEGLVVAAIRATSAARADQEVSS